MGIKTELCVSQARALFPHLNILSLQPTHEGVIDTTYILETPGENYILKKYERALKEQREEEARLLKHLRAHGLNVPVHLDSSDEWQLFSYLKGHTPKRPNLSQLRSLGAFLGKMHALTRGKKASFTPFEKSSFIKAVGKLRRHDLLLAKRLNPLLYFEQRFDGIIHADLFPDNAKFDALRIGVFDFIEAGNGSFAFDAGVTAMSWISTHRQLSRSKLQLFLNAYNQNAPCKLTLDLLLTQMQSASLVYALQRRLNDGHDLSHKPMLRKHSGIRRFRKDILKRARL
ncbi:MAG: phosphotransferase [Campylobacterales bacterium]|nr:phosphotransferase [Campylobacterales bacterium]